MTLEERRRIQLYEGDIGSQISDHAKRRHKTLMGIEDEARIVETETR
jgi:hypothetical protein